MILICYSLYFVLNLAIAQENAVTSIEPSVTVGEEPSVTPVLIKKSEDDSVTPDTIIDENSVTPNTIINSEEESVTQAPIKIVKNEPICSIEPKKSTWITMKNWWFHILGHVEQVNCEQNYDDLKRFWPVFQQKFESLSKNFFTLHNLVNKDEIVSDFERCGLYLRELEYANEQISSNQVHQMLAEITHFSSCASKLNQEVIVSDVPETTLIDIKKMMDKSSDLIIKMCSFKEYQLPEYKKYIKKISEECQLLVATTIMLPTEDINFRINRIVKELKKLITQITELQIKIKKITGVDDSNEKEITQHWTKTISIIDQLIAYTKPAGTLMFGINEALMAADIDIQRMEKLDLLELTPFIKSMKTDRLELKIVKKGIRQAYDDANDVKRTLRQQKYALYSFEHRAEQFHNIVKIMKTVVGQLNKTITELKVLSNNEIFQ